MWGATAGRAVVELGGQEEARAARAPHTDKTRRLGRAGARVECGARPPGALSSSSEGKKKRARRARPTRTRPASSQRTRRAWCVVTRAGRGRSRRRGRGRELRAGGGELAADEREADAAVLRVEAPAREGGARPVLARRRERQRQLRRLGRARRPGAGPRAPSWGARTSPCAPSSPARCSTPSWRRSPRPRCRPPAAASCRSAPSPTPARRAGCEGARPPPATPRGRPPPAARPRAAPTAVAPATPSSVRPNQSASRPPPARPRGRSRRRQRRRANPPRRPRRRRRARAVGARCYRGLEPTRSDDRDAGARIGLRGAPRQHEELRQRAGHLRGAAGRRQEQRLAGAREHRHHRPELPLGREEEGEAARGRGRGR